MIELVDFNEIYGGKAEDKAAPAKKTRRAGSTKKKATEDGEATTEEKAAE
jgi:large subunit ribosomal protein L17